MLEGGQSQLDREAKDYRTNDCHYLVAGIPQRPRLDGAGGFMDIDLGRVVDLAKLIHLPESGLAIFDGAGKGVVGFFINPLVSVSLHGTMRAFAARVVKLVDTRDLKSLAGNSVPVQVRPRAPSFVWFNSLFATFV